MLSVFVHRCTRAADTPRPWGDKVTTGLFAVALLIRLPYPPGPDPGGGFPVSEGRTRSASHTSARAHRAASSRNVERDARDRRRRAHTGGGVTPDTGLAVPTRADRAGARGNGATRSVRVFRAP